MLVISDSVSPWQAFQAYSNSHSSLLQKLVNYGHKKFGPSGMYYKTLQILSKLVGLFVQACFCSSKKKLAYYEIGQCPVNYKFVMFYGTVSRGLYHKT